MAAADVVVLFFLGTFVLLHTHTHTHTHTRTHTRACVNRGGVATLSSSRPVLIQRGRNDAWPCMIRSALGGNATAKKTNKKKQLEAKKKEKNKKKKRNRRHPTRTKKMPIFLDHSRSISIYPYLIIKKGFLVLCSFDITGSSYFLLGFFTEFRKKKPALPTRIRNKKKRKEPERRPMRKKSRRLARRTSRLLTLNQSERRQRRDVDVAPANNRRRRRRRRGHGGRGPASPTGCRPINAAGQWRSRTLAPPPGP